jgi:hypothetical protein
MVSLVPSKIAKSLEEQAMGHQEQRRQQLAAIKRADNATDDEAARDAVARVQAPRLKAIMRGRYEAANQLDCPFLRLLGHIP